MRAAVSFVACVAWRFCRATTLLSDEAANARPKERRTREKYINRLLGFVAFSTAVPSSHFDILLTTCLVSIPPYLRVWMAASPSRIYSAGSATDFNKGTLRLLSVT